MKALNPDRDVINQISAVNENIVFGGSLFSSSAGEPNIKRTIHWTSGSTSGSFYHAIYNSNYTQSNAVELVDVTYGQSISSSYYNDALATNKDEKNRVYRLYAKLLLGDENSRFNFDSADRDNLVFLHVRRSQFKDEIKKGSVSILCMASGASGGSDVISTFSSRSITDDGAASAYSETNRGDTADLLSASTVVGKIWYQAGVVALVPELASNTSSVADNPGNTWSGSIDYGALVTSGSYESVLTAVRTRFRNVSFINQTNLHATYYFCRALNDEANYSANPTFTDDSGRIVPTSGANNLQTRTYITKVGLVGENGEILAVASLSEPIKKTPDIEFSVKVRLDY